MLRRLSTALLLLALTGTGPTAARAGTAAGTAPPDSTGPPSATAPAPGEHDPDLDASDWHDLGDAVGDRAPDYVGAHEAHGALYDQESAVYRVPPPLRYNRVEGVVFGLQREPLRFGPEEETRVFGQVAYATALNDVRYTAGLESQLYATETTGLKLGVTYQEQTLSPDRWKTSYLENSLASVGFRYDFFDYYEAEGVSVYGVQDLPASLQLAGGVRAEEHRRLAVNTGWSVFERGDVRDNPAVEAGRMQALFASLTGGRVQDRDDLPTGQAFRLAATVADGVGGDFSFYRYEADGRLFLPLTPETRLGLRVRGGYATSQAPLQSQFTIGGIGSVRSYDQNRFRGTRMLLANAEYLIDGATIIDGLLDDLFVAGLFDAGWVGGPADRPRLDDVLPSAGFGIGLDEREVRLDVSWPLRDVPGAGSKPAIWLRITPNF
jgi:hypothetical protein